MCTWFFNKVYSWRVYCGLKYSNCSHPVSDIRLESGRYEPHFHPKTLYVPAKLRDLTIQKTTAWEGYLQNFSRDVTSKEPHPAVLVSGPCLKAIFVMSLWAFGFCHRSISWYVCNGRLVQIACCGGSCCSVPKACQVLWFSNWRGEG